MSDPYFPADPNEETPFNQQQRGKDGLPAQASVPPLSAASLSATPLPATPLPATLELHEERLVIEKQRAVAGRVNIHREVRRETVQVPVELVTEVLVIEHGGGPHGVRIGDELLASGERREIVVYREAAQVSTVVVVSEEVRIDKRQLITTETVSATLAREELVVSHEGDVQWSAPVTETGPRDTP